MSLPTSRYYPAVYWMHAKVARPFTKSVLDMPVKGRTSSDFEKQAFAVCMRNSPGLDFSKGMDSPDVLALSEDAKGLLVWAQWYIDGKSIIEIAPELAIELARSDAGDLRPADLLAERESYYLHFGLPLEDSPLIDGQFPVEGAYVLCEPGVAIRVTLVSRSAPQGPCSWQGRYDLRLVHPFLDVPADEAIERAIRRDLADIEQHATLAQGANAQTAFGVVAQRVHDNKGAYAQAVRYILNAMAYRRYVNDSTVLKWQEDSPQSLAQKAQVPGKEGVRSTSKLWFMGFLPARVLGQSFRHIRFDGLSVTTHWRRGHWRNQSHGPQMSLRKLIWIRPTLVNAEPGH